jgi:hypothetical protein
MASVVTGMAVLGLAQAGAELPAPVIGPGEHPRLICRSNDLVAVRARAQSEEGKKIVATMERLAVAQLAQRDQVKEAGYQAAGMGCLYAIQGNPEQARLAADGLRKRVLGYPLEGSLSAMERYSRVAGSALAFDLACTAWDTSTREALAKGMQDYVLRVAGPLGSATNKAMDVLDVVGWSSLALAGLTLFDEPCATPELKRVLDRGLSVLSAHLTESISAKGTDRNGEGMKQVLFASGGLACLHAYRNVFGKSLPGTERIGPAMVATMLQSVPGTGTFRFSEVGSVMDRSGVFPMSLGLLSESERGWVLDFQSQVFAPGVQDLGRAPHGLYLLGVDPAALKAVSPAGKLPLVFEDREGGLFLFRSAWAGSGDILAGVNLYGAPDASVSHLWQGDFRILGLGTQWASFWGAHAMQWGPRECRIRNTAGFVGDDPKVKASTKVTCFADNKDGSGVISLRRTGHLSLAVASEAPKKEGNRNDKSAPVKTVEGDFTILRSFGADYSGLAGVPAVFAVVDRIEGVTNAPAAWNMNSLAGYRELTEKARALEAEEVTRRAALDADLQAGKLTTVELEKKRGEVSKEIEKRIRGLSGSFQATNSVVLTSRSNATCKVTFVPNQRDLVLAPKPNGSYWNCLVAQGEREYFALLTLQEGEPPAVKIDGKGLSARVQVGRRVISFDGEKIVFSKAD